MATNLPTWPYSAPRKEEAGEWGGASGLDDLMLSAVSDFSGLDGIMEAAKEETPQVTRFSQAPEFPELLPEVRAELEEIQAAMDAARTSRQASAAPIAVSQAVSDEVDRVIGKGMSELPVSRTAAWTLSGSPEPESALPSASGISAPILNAPRHADFEKLRRDFFEVLSSDESFPPFHAKTLLDLCARIESGTPESELAQVGNVLLYLVENLGTHFDREFQWEERKDRYFVLTGRTKGGTKKFRFRALSILSSRESERTAVNETAARAAFDADYGRRREKFISKLKDNGSVSQGRFRTDISDKEYGKTASRCFSVALELWKDVYMETAAIKSQLYKIHWAALVRKIEKIQATFDWSEVERMEELEAARVGNFRPLRNRNRHRQKADFPTAAPSDSAFASPASGLDVFSQEFPE